MSLYKFSWVLFNCWVLSLMLFKAHGDCSGISVNFLTAPNSTTSLNSATFRFNVTVDGQEVWANDSNCKCPHITCKLDYNNATDCGNKEASYTGLQDGNHKFEVCSVGSPGVGCSTYNWIVDTVPPKAYITSPPPSSNAKNVSINISFSEACIGKDGKEGFKCPSVNTCNLLVSGDGQVIPSSLVTLVPKRQYSLLVGFMVEHGNVTLELDNNFCADSAGNEVIKGENSTTTFNVSFDRRIVLVNLSSPAPKKQVQLDTGNKTVLETNNYEDLRLYLNFSESVLNSSEEIRKSMNTTQGTLVAIRGGNPENRTFGFKVVNVFSYAEITVSIDTKSILTKLGNPVSPIEPTTFIYDSRRPEATLIPECKRTREHIVRIDINFTKPVLNITDSWILINGGQLLSLVNKSGSLYRIEVLFDKAVSVQVRENVTQDVIGNKNLACDPLTVMHYPVPVLSTVSSAIVTSTVAATSLVTGLLTVSTGGLQPAGLGALPPSFISNPAGNLFRSIGHIQVYALSRWLAVTLPVEYDEFARSLQWSIPYFNLPWEKRHVQPDISSKFQHLERFQNVHMGRGSTDRNVENQSPKSITAFLDTLQLEGWEDFNRSMFWLAVIGGSLILSHVLLILILKYKLKTQWKYYGVIASPKFEICLLILALPCVCKASAGLIKGGIESEEEPKNKPDDKLGIAVGSLLLGVVASILLCIVLFLSLGVTLGKLLQYEASHQPRQKARWYERFLGPDEKGKWTWRNQSNNFYMILSPLFDELRGPLISHKQGGGRIRPAEGSPREHDEGNTAATGETKEAKTPESNPQQDDHEIASANKTKGTAAPGVSPQEHDEGTTAATGEIKEAKTPESNPQQDDHEIASPNETKDREAPAGSPLEHDEGNTAATGEKKEAKTPESNPQWDDHEIASANETKGTEAPGGNPQEDDDKITAAPDETQQAEAPETSPHKDDDHNNASANETQVTEAPAGSNPHEDDDSTTRFDKERLYGTLRIYYTLLQSVKQVTLGTLAGAYLHQRSTKSPSIILLCITSFQLLFVVILKPFVKKMVQLVEMISLSCEVGMLTLCLVHFGDELSPDEETTRVTRRGITMVVFFLIGYIPQMIVECYDLFTQIKDLDKNSKSQSFLVGLKIANYGLLLVLLPEEVMNALVEKFPDLKPAGANLLRSADSIKADKEPGEVTKSSEEGNKTLALCHPSTSNSGRAAERPTQQSRVRRSFSFVTVASDIFKNLKKLEASWCGS